jgi:dihydroorotase
MNTLLLRQVTVIDPGGMHHDETVDVLIIDGRISNIGKRLPRTEAPELHIAGLHLSPGWVETRAHFRDPGEEYKEGVSNGLDAAAAGGFTQVAVLPSTEPIMDSRAGVEYLLRKAQGHAVRLLPLGALTKGLNGQQLAEHFDMREAGAVAFCDDQHPVRNTRLMLLALQYALNFDGRVISCPMDADLSAQGQMHEGHMSVRLGLRGIPAVAETIQLARDLSLLEYTGSRMHVATISTAESVQLIRQAKAKKLRVTASVAAHNLLLDDGCLRGFDTNYKVLPPLRDSDHIEALREGVKDGTIDTITSDHRPEDTEHKKVEFPQAAAGIIGLETAYAVANTAMKSRLSTRKLVERFCHGPRAALGSRVPHLEEGTEADITLFAPDHEWTFTESDIVSRSKNTPFVGYHFTGKVMGIVSQGQVRLCNNLVATTA